MESISTTVDYNNAAYNDNNDNDNDNDSRLFRPLPTRGVLRRSATILWDNLLFFLTMAAVVVVPVTLILVVALFTINWATILPTTDDTDADADADDADADEFEEDYNGMIHARPVLLVWLVVVMVHAFLGTAMQAAVMRVVADVYAGKRNSPLELQQHDLAVYLRHYLLNNASLLCSIVCYNVVLHLGIYAVVLGLELAIFMVMLLCTLLAYLVLGEGLITNDNAAFWLVLAELAKYIRLALLVTTSIYAHVSMFAAIPSLVLEQQQQQQARGFLAAMQRSWDLVTTRRCFVLHAKAWYALAVWLPLMILVIITVVVLGNTSMLWFFFWILLVLALANLVVVPFHAIFQVVLYLTVRIEKEGCSRSVLVREIGSLTEPYNNNNNSGDEYHADGTITTRSNNNVNIMLNDASSAGLQQAPIFKTDESLTTVNDHQQGDNQNDHNSNVNNFGAKNNDEGHIV